MGLTFQRRYHEPHEGIDPKVEAEVGDLTVPGAAEATADVRDESRTDALAAADAYDEGTAGRTTEATGTALDTGTRTANPTPDGRDGKVVEPAVVIEAPAEVEHASASTTPNPYSNPASPAPAADNPAADTAPAPDAPTATSTDDRASDQHVDGSGELVDAPPPPADEATEPTPDVEAEQAEAEPEAEQQASGTIISSDPAPADEAPADDADGDGVPDPKPLPAS